MVLFYTHIFPVNSQRKCARNFDGVASHQNEAKNHIEDAQKNIHFTNKGIYGGIIIYQQTQMFTLFAILIDEK